MEGGEGMTLQGSDPYYLHRGFPGPGQPGFSSSSRPGSNPGQTVVRGSGSGSMAHGGFKMEANNNNNVHHQGFTIAVAASDGGGAVGGGGGVGGVGGVGGSLSDTVKKKRGRPRKYAPDGRGVGVCLGSGPGTVALGLSPSSPNSDDRRKRGRPPGSGRKQRLAAVGEWMNNSAGFAFTPHVLHVSPGEDIASKILSFSQQRPRAVCIMSGSGGVSTVTLRQPASSTGTVTFEGRFEILCLSGSYLVSETGSTRDRVGGVNVSLSSPDGRLVGGAVGRLIAAKPVMVVLCTFAYGNAKSKSNDDPKEKSPEQLLSDKTSVHANSPHNQNIAVSWPGSRGVDQRNPNTDINLASG